MQKLLVPTLALALLLPITATAGPLENHAGAVAAADRLVEVQLASGAFPWIVGQTGEYQNVQGVTALGVLEAYKVTLDADYLASATKTRDWLAAYMAANPGAFVSSSNTYFLAEYALLTLELDDLELARAAFQTALDRYGTPENVVTSIIHVRANSHKLGNLGLWDAALFVRAAQDIGNLDAADAMANALATQTIVDPFAPTQTYYEIGLAGLLFGLGEADLVAHLDTLTAARDALLAAQCENGSWPVTYRGVVYCDDPQTTAYVVEGFTFVGELLGAQSGCDYLAASQSANGGWDLGGYEIAEVDAEAAAALVACLLPARNGATSYADAAVGLL